MRKLLTLLFILSITTGAAQKSQAIKDYIETYREIAIEEMIRTGVPACITLAQGIHESSAGQSHLVKKSNNHFGIKCKSDWKGESVSHDDDARGECFRKYDDPIDSYRDHSDFLKYRKHYASLFELDPTDYEGWAYGLKKAGYATNPKYPQLLIRIIKDYNLQEYTLIALERINNLKENDGVILVNQAESEAMSPVESAQEETKISYDHFPSGKFKINDTKVMVIREGTSYLAVAEENGISLARMFEFNDMKPADIAPHDHLVFLQRKRKTGSNEFHTVSKGETLHYISQVNGIRLASLLEYNLLSPDDNPAEGSKLFLKAPTEVKSSASLTSESGNNTVSELHYHTVQQKETLYAISKKYDVAVNEIMQWNNLSSTDLKQGQEIRIYKKNSNDYKGKR